MSDIKTISTPHAATAIGPYSQAVCAGGLVFVSGQIPVAPESGTLVASDIDAQTDQVLRNLDAILRAAGAGIASLVKVTIYLSDLDDFEAVNLRYAEWLGAARPARVTVEVSRLPKGARLEMDAVALLP